MKMVAFNRPDVLNTAIKKVLMAKYGNEVISEGPGWSESDAKHWNYFAEDYSIKNGEANQPEFGNLPPLLQLWVNSLTPEIEDNADKYGLAPVTQSKNHPNPTNYLPNVGGEPDAEFDEAGQPVYKKVDKDGNPVGISAADQAQMRKVLNNTVPSSADATQTKGVDGEGQQAGKVETAAQAEILPGASNQPGGPTHSAGPASGLTEDEKNAANARNQPDTNPSGNPKGKPNDASSGGSVRVRTN